LKSGTDAKAAHDALARLVLVKRKIQALRVCAAAAETGIRVVGVGHLDTVICHRMLSATRLPYSPIHGVSAAWTLGVVTIYDGPAAKGSVA
jgi:hypothetical protein